MYILVWSCSTSQYSYRKEAKYCATEEIKKFGIALTSQTHLQEIKLLLNQNEIKEIVFVITVKKSFQAAALWVIH